MINVLQRFLPMAEKVVPRKTTLSILENVCIDSRAVVATDLEITMRMFIPSDISCLIPMPIFRTIIKSKPATLTLEKIDELKVRLNYDNRSVEFSSHDMNDYPMMLQDNFTDVGVWDKSIVMTLHSLTAFCSDDELRPNLNGVYIKQEKSGITMVATDGHVLKRVIMDGEFEEMQAIIPKRALLILSRIVKRQVAVAKSEDSVRFIIDHNIEMVVKTIAAEYPNVDRVIPKKLKHHMTVDKEKLLDLLVDAKAFAHKESRQAMLLLTKAQMTLSLDNIERNIEWQATIDIEGNISEDFQIGVNVDYLDKVLKDIIEDKVFWQFNEPAEAMLLNGVGVKHEVLLLMPIRIREVDDEEE